MTELLLKIAKKSNLEKINKLIFRRLKKSSFNNKQTNKSVHGIKLLVLKKLKQTNGYLYKLYYSFHKYSFKYGNNVPTGYQQ